MIKSKLLKYSRIALIVTTTAAMGAAIFPLNASARHPGPRHGPAILPMIHVGTMAYFFMDGLFYHRGPKGYVVAAAPVGAKISVLPSSAVLVKIDDNSYYNCSGVFYKKVPGGYVVVSQPVKQVSPEIGVGQDVLVIVDLLNVRSGPGLNFETIGQLVKNEIMRVEALSANWALIKIRDNSNGWIKLEYTSVIQTGAKG